MIIAIILRKFAPLADFHAIAIQIPHELHMPIFSISRLRFHAESPGLARGFGAWRQETKALSFDNGSLALFAGVTVEIAGRLNALLGEQAYPNKVRGVWGKVVAGERYRLSPHGSNPRCFLRSFA